MQCVEIIREQDPEGRGISRWQLRRRLKRWDEQAGGRLLRWRGAPGGVREVNSAVLLQLLRADPLERERELAEVHDRIDVVDDRTRAIRSRLRRHGVRLDEHERRLEAQKKALQALETCAKHLAGA